MTTNGDCSSRSVLSDGFIRTSDRDCGKPSDHENISLQFGGETNCPKAPQRKASEQCNSIGNGLNHVTCECRRLPERNCGPGMSYVCYNRQTHDIGLYVAVISDLRQNLLKGDDTMTESSYPPLNSVKRCPKCNMALPGNGPITGWSTTYVPTKDAIKRHCTFCNHFWYEAPYNPDKEGGLKRDAIHVAKGDTVEITGSDYTKKSARVTLTIESDDKILIDVYGTDGSLLKGGSIDLLLHRSYPMAFYSNPNFNKFERGKIDVPVKTETKVIDLSRVDRLVSRLGLLKRIQRLLTAAFVKTREINSPGDYYSMNWSGFDELFDDLRIQIDAIDEELGKEK